MAGLREVSAILNYKTDTFGIDATLEKAASMERRVHAEAFGDRARLEAAAKIHQAETAAKQDAQKISDAGRSKYSPPENIPVHNALFVVRAPRDEQAERIGRLRDIDAALQARKDLSDGEKNSVAKHLNSREAANILEKFKKPEDVIAVGLFKARVMDLEDAVKDLPLNRKMDVTNYVHPEAEKKNRDKDRGNDRGLGRSL